MNRLMKKIQSNNGASMILALVVLLICVTVASMIITAASAGASRSVERTKQQRGYLAVASAAQLIAEELDRIDTATVTKNAYSYPCQEFAADTTWYGDLVYRIPVGTTFSGEYVSYFGRESRTVTDSNYESMKACLLNVHAAEEENIQVLDTFSGLFAETMDKAVLHVYTTATAYEETFTIAPTVEDERIAKVSCRFTMAEDYNIRIYVTSEDSDYSVMVSMMGIASPPTETITDSLSGEHTVRYKAYRWWGVYEETSGIFKCQGTEYLVTNNITWYSPSISKGGVTE